MAPMTVAQSLARLGPQFTQQRPDTPAERLTDQLAAALGWTQEGSHVLRVDPTPPPLQLSQGVVGNQAAAVFVSGRGSAIGQPLETGALFAYHAAIQWGLVATDQGTVIFNSHWIRDNTWFHLPVISWDNVERHNEIFEAITPEGLTAGKIETVATRERQPERSLRPVDSALVERLDFWRAEALRHAPALDSLDEKLQVLFAQFFVLRVIEDRHLDQDIPALSALHDRQGGIDYAQLDQVLDSAQHRVQSELFHQRVHREFPSFVVAGVIDDLYVPRELPRSGLQYDFAWINSDVLGRAYQKYLSSILEPVPHVPPQLHLFDQPLREVRELSVQKQMGVYYTPDYLVGYLTERALDHFFQRNESNSLPRIADFSCGSGSFLTTAVDRLLKRLRRQHPESSRNWGREIAEHNLIVGVDNDPRAVTLARLSLWLRLAEEPDPLPLPALERAVVCGDALLDSSFKALPDSYDIVLGNPPFLPTERMPDRNELVKRFRSALGRFDYSYLFVEQAIAKLTESGVLAMVVPNRLFRNAGAQALREIVQAETDVLTLVDFGSTEVFAGTSSYIGGLIARKRCPGCSSPHVRVIVVREHRPRMLGARLYEADVSTEELRTPLIEAFSVPQPRDARSWLLLSSRTRRQRVRLEDQSVLLQEVAVVAQGMRTGANDVFVVELTAEPEGPLAWVRNDLGYAGFVEASLLRPAVYGADIRRYDVVHASRYLVYPYRDSRVISPVDLEAAYPHAWKYLNAHKDILVDRRSVTGSGLEWYELVRRRDEEWLTSPKLLIRDLALRPTFAIDQTGSVFLVGGTAVVPRDSSLLLPLLGYLNSSVVDWYVRDLTPSFRTGYQKYEPQHLSLVPVPEAILVDDDLQGNLGQLVSLILAAAGVDPDSQTLSYERTIDDLLSAALGLDIRH